MIDQFRSRQLANDQWHFGFIGYLQQILWNFPVITRDFLDDGALVQVKDEAGLEAELGRLLESPELAASVGRRAMGVVEKRKGVVARSVDELLARVPEWSRILGA